jgi:hypothetical protein
MDILQTVMQSPFFLLRIVPLVSPLLEGRTQPLTRCFPELIKPLPARDARWVYGSRGAGPWSLFSSDLGVLWCISVPSSPIGKLFGMQTHTHTHTHTFFWLTALLAGFYWRVADGGVACVGSDGGILKLPQT